jgi:hypothetical protein
MPVRCAVCACVSASACARVKHFCLKVNLKLLDRKPTMLWRIDVVCEVNGGLSHTLVFYTMLCGVIRRWLVRRLPLRPCAHNHRRMHTSRALRAEHRVGCSRAILTVLIC